jgi:sugar (pentulose or hexulose) kinase
MVACYCKCRPGSFGQGGSSRDLGIGFLGQMHGLVLLDQKKNLVRPATIWADQRSADLLSEIVERVGLDLLGQQCGTAPTAFSDRFPVLDAKV